MMRVRIRASFAVSIIVLAMLVFVWCRSGDDSRVGGNVSDPDVVLRPGVASPPRRLPAEFRRSDDAPRQAFVVEVVDVLGAPLGGSAVSLEGRPLGFTDEGGILELRADTARLALPRSGILAVRCEGYADVHKLVATTGRVRVSLVPEATIAGVVLERRTNEPVGALRVATGARSTVADDQGRFRFRGLPPGAHALRAHGRGYAGETSRPVVVGLGTQRTDVQIFVDPSHTIEGRVHAAGQRPDLPLHVSASAGSSTLSAMGELTEVDDEGRFTFSGMSPGNYKLTVFPSDAVASNQFSPLLVPSVSVDLDRDVRVDIDIGRLHALLVEVVDERANPVPGIRINFRQSNDSMLVGAFRETDVFGRAWVDGLAAGPVKHIRPDVAGIEPVTVVVPTEEIVRFTIPARVSLFGRLLTEDGAPPQSRMLVLRPQEDRVPAAVAASDVRGEFHLDGLSAGSYDVEIHANGAELRVAMGSEGAVPEYTVPVTLEAGEASNEILITLPVRMGTLAGRVVDGAGGGIAGAIVTHMLDREGPPPDEASVGEAVIMTDLQGYFRFSDVEVGPRLVVTVWAPDGVYVTRRGVLAGPDPIELIFSGSR